MILPTPVPVPSWRKVREPLAVAATRASGTSTLTRTGSARSSARFQAYVYLLILFACVRSEVTTPRAVSAASTEYGVDHLASSLREAHSPFWNRSALASRLLAGPPSPVVQRSHVSFVSNFCITSSPRAHQSPRSLSRYAALERNHCDCHTIHVTPLTCFILDHFILYPLCRWALASIVLSTSLDGRWVQKYLRSKARGQKKQEYR